MSGVRIVLPAKAMLFGEYGVLAGYPAVAVTLPAFRFVVNVSMTIVSTAEAGLEVHSAFLPEGRFFLSFGGAAPEVPGVQSLDVRHRRFFEGLIHPFATDLLGRRVTLSVEEAYSPSLGFGSSSALLSATHLALWRLLYGESNPSGHADFWKRIRLSLERVQGRGSGYDVGVQVAHCAAGLQKAAVWGFFPGEFPRVERLDVPDLERFGCFLATGVYSDTAEAVKAILGEDVISEHGELALEFLHAPTASLLPHWMARSLVVAKKQGLLLDSQGTLAKFAHVLQGLPWKTMGSGRGDCLWVAADSSELTELRHPLRDVSLKDSVVFSFSSLES